MYSTILNKITNLNFHWIGTGAADLTCPSIILEKKIKYKIISSFIFKKNWLRIFSKYPFVLLHYILLYLIYTPYSFFKIKKFVLNESIEIIWIETFKQTYLLAYLLDKFCKCKIHLSFNDHFSAHSLKPEQYILKYFFKKLLKKSFTYDFISDGMLEYYRRNYNFNSQNYMIFWIGEQFKIVTKRKFNNKISKIIFYGNIHGLNTFYSFCDSIHEINAQQNNNITIDIYSQVDFCFIEKKYSFVNYMGSITSNQLALNLQNYDLVYVPMYFDEKNSIVARTSISSKMLLAINATIPIFSHAPKFSANSLFVEKNNIGITCPYIDKTKIIELIVNLTNLELIEYSKNESILNHKTFQSEDISNFEKLLTL